MDSVLNYLIKLQANGDSVVHVAQKTSEQLDNVSNKAKTVGTRLREAFSFSSLKNSLMAVPGMEFLTNPYTMAAGAIGAITKIGAEAEQTSIAFTTLVGSEKKAKDMLGEITKFANSSPFGMLDLTENAKTMLNFGVETGKVLPLLKRLGDISGGDKNRLQSLSLVLGQVAAAGKLQGQDNLQLVGAGFAPLQELANMTGKSYAEIQDKMAKGQITFENVVQAIEHATGSGGRFFGMMDKQAKSVPGKFSTMLDTIKTGAIGFYNKIQPLLSKILDIANSTLPIVSNLLMGLFDKLTSGVKFLISFRTEFAYLASVIAVSTLAFRAHAIGLAIYTAGAKVVAVVTRDWAIAHQVLNAVMNANPIGLIITAIAALTAGVIYCWNKFAGFRAFFSTLGGTIVAFGNIIKTYIINRFNEMLSGIGKLGEALKRLFNGDFKGAASSALEGYKKLSGAGSAADAIGKTKSLVTGVSAAYSRNYALESAKDRKSPTAKTKDSKIAHPGQKGSAQEVVFGSGTAKDGKKKGGGHTGGRKSAEEIATGGTRNTSISMTIGKFFDNIYVTMTDKADTAELERTILEAMNRALAIATSTDR